MWRTKPEGLNEISNAIGELLKARSAAGKISYTEETTIALRKVKELIPYWSINLEEFIPGTSDRKGNLFGGMPFTSHEHAWPINKKGNPYYPLVQVDLTNVSNITKKRFGDGLLQVWLDVDSDLRSMHHVMRIIRPKDLECIMTPPVIEESETDFYGIWGGSDFIFSFEFKGFVCPSLPYIDRIDFDLFSKEELTAFVKLRSILDQNGWQSIQEEDWLLGYPDRGSGAPAGLSYEEMADNFIQLGSSESFALVGIGKVANIFYTDLGDHVDFDFYWGG